MRILILEDDPQRVCRFRELFKALEVELRHVATAADAIALLHSDRFDAVFLDHDLGGRVYVDSDEPNTGFQVAKALPETLNRSSFVVVHSWNPGGTEKMLDVLQRKGCRAQAAPFGSFDAAILGTVRTERREDAEHVG